MHKFRIEMSSPTRGRVWIDDKEIEGVKSVRFSAGHDEIAEVTLTVCAGEAEVSVDDTIEVTDMSDTERRFVKAVA